MGGGEDGWRGENDGERVRMILEMKERVGGRVNKGKMRFF